MVWKAPRKSSDRLKWDSKRPEMPVRKPLIANPLPEHRIYFDVPVFLAWLSDQPENCELVVNHKTMNCEGLVKLNPERVSMLVSVIPRFVAEILSDKPVALPDKP